MKRGLLLVATLSLCSALYAQGTLTREEAREVFAAYNPALLQKAAQDEQLNQLLDQLLRQFVSQHSADTLENRYTLIALARNFENSLALNQTLAQYQQALIYSQHGTDVTAAARAHAREKLNTLYPRIWAVSVQVKETLLRAYKVQKNAQLAPAITALQADLAQLKTNVGAQLITLTQQALAQAEQQAQQAAQATNLHIKTNHKKPVAG